MQSPWTSLQQLREVADLALPFATDEDNPGEDGINPMVSLFDLGDEPVDYWDDRVSQPLGCIGSSDSSVAGGLDGTIKASWRVLEVGGRVVRGLVYGMWNGFEGLVRSSLFCRLCVLSVFRLCSRCRSLLHPDSLHASSHCGHGRTGRLQRGITHILP